MKNELNTLKDLVLILAANKGRPETLNLMMTEAGRLPDTITANIFDLSSDYQVRQYICWHLNMLVNEADLLYKSCLKQPSRILKKGLVVILDLLKTLNRMFPEHAENTIPLPVIFYNKEAARLKPLLEEFAALFRDNAVEDELSRIALFPLSNFLQQTGGHRYRDYRYLLKFTTILKTVDFNKRGTTTANDLLCARLVAVNYNSIALMDYCTAKVKLELDKSDSRQEKELCLKRMQKWLKQVTVMSGIAYDAGFPGIKEALLDWAEQETEGLALDVPLNQAETETELEKLEISVGVLAYLTRLSVVHGIRKVKPKTEIADQIVHTYSSKQTQKISKGSFINCYKAPRTGVARALRKILRAMLEDVDYFIKEGVVRDSSEQK